MAMGEAFKEYFNPAMVATTGSIFERAHPGFDRQRFERLATEGLAELELKARAIHIMQALDATLPDDFDAFARVALAALHPSEDPQGEGLGFGAEGVAGFGAWPLTDLVTHRGIGCPEKALPLLKEVTKRFSAEFAIRPFLKAHRDFTLSVMNGWVDDDNRHVRRLVSEGTRPRLPWGMRLQDFVVDPAPILPFLTALRDDPEDYVRRSVANNLNDIAKDHPDRVAAIAADWLRGAPAARKRLVRHACRTLVKQGHEATLAAFGLQAIDGLGCRLGLARPVVHYGEALEFDVDLHGGTAGQSIVLDYAIHFLKANGSTAPKVFKWKETVLDHRGCLAANRRHAIRPITTRTYYAGRQQLEILVNGVSVAKADFDLVM